MSSSPIVEVIKGVYQATSYYLCTIKIPYYLNIVHYMTLYNVHIDCLHMVDSHFWL